MRTVERMIDTARIETFDLRSRRIGHTDDILVDRQGDRDEGREGITRVSVRRTRTENQEIESGELGEGIWKM